MDSVGAAENIPSGILTQNEHEINSMSGKSADCAVLGGSKTITLGSTSLLQPVPMSPSTTVNEAKRITR